MKKPIIFVAATLLSFAALAYSCRYFSYTINGRTYYCTECCYGSGQYRTCNTTCN
jgi:hypothetical protein